MKEIIASIAQKLTEAQWHTRRLYREHTKLRPELSEDARAALRARLEARGRAVQSRAPEVIELVMRRESEWALEAELQRARGARPLSEVERDLLALMRAQDVLLLEVPKTAGQLRTLELAVEEGLPVVLLSPNGLPEGLEALGVLAAGSLPEGLETARRWGASLRAPDNETRRTAA